MGESRIHLKEGLDKGRIADEGVAAELAQLEATKGRNAALAREKEMAEDLTELQREHLRAIENLPGKYPHAFAPDHDGTPIRVSGRHGEYLVTRPVSGSPTAVITKDGCALVRERMGGRSLEAIDVEKMDRLGYDLTAVFDAKAPGGWRKFENVSFGGVGDWVNLVVVETDDKGTLRELSSDLKEVLGSAEERYKDEEPKGPRPDILEIL